MRGLACRRLTVRRQDGFTLIEAMVVVAIVGILAAIGIPSMRDLIASTRVKGAASDVFATLIFARSEAVKRNAGVDVIPASTSNWGAGWSVRAVGTTVTLAAQEPITGEVSVNGPAFTIRYRGDGRLIDATTGSLLGSDVSFTFLSSVHSHIHMRCITIDPSGRPNVRIDGDQDSSNGCT